MNIFFERKIDSNILSCFLSKILNLNLKEVLVFEENYFVENIDVEIGDDIKCLCLYISVEGDVEIRAEIFRVPVEMNKIVDNVFSFLNSNSSIGSIYIENLNNDEFYLMSSMLVERVELSDEFLNQGLYKFDRIEN